MVIVNSLTVSPDPVALPGTVTIGFSVLFKDTVNSPVSTDVQIKKSVFGTFVTIPCIENFGSCHYDDFCTILSGVTCPEEFQEHGIPCNCPFTTGNYTLMPGISFTVDVPFLPSGDYYASANMTSNKQHVGCVELYATFA
ncbi:hypothetical protein LOTGIDRAFT_116316 [Lottia gigantea]|uniref:MD-2-related lipid-recognition domain-containing protein n=1 Tax=Lottia gigantea TaxID=225164 RepID=V3ZWZ2_LOTGI|nr:hypothetical protein LOTGIDRAFT_116316 [Lottia gigantea]ESO96043.1 hypothetical protein LOTGIDRAFT_116316 [Lottia gigantea]